MSHASAIVAIDRPVDLAEAEMHISPLMAPFDENGAMFRDGSRWDWWMIGGRFSGKLVPDYDPHQDEKLFQECRLCSGTGQRLDMVVADGCNGCQGTGRSMLWPTEWPMDLPGNICLVRDLPVFPAHKLLHAAVFLKRNGGIIEWQEVGRMGWFGLPATSERPQQSNRDWTITFQNKSARIITWSDSETTWYEQFRERFISSLPPDTTLVVVDFHV